jgi:hypothetical protein
MIFLFKKIHVQATVGGHGLGPLLFKAEPGCPGRDWGTAVRSFFSKKSRFDATDACPTVQLKGNTRSSRQVRLPGRNHEHEAHRPGTW